MLERCFALYGIIATLFGADEKGTVVFPVCDKKYTSSYLKNRNKPSYIETILLNRIMKLFYGLMMIMNKM